MTAAKPAARGIQIQLVQIVQHVERDLPDLQHVGLGDVRRPALAIVVATDRGDGCDPAERLEDVRRADVARVHDALDAGQRGQRLRPHQAVRVGDHAKGVNAGSHRGWPLGSGSTARGLSRTRWPIATRAGSASTRIEKIAMAADLHDREHTGPGEARGQPGLLHGEAVDRPLGRQVRPRRRRRCRTPHRSRAAARPRGRSRCSVVVLSVPCPSRV